MTILSILQYPDPRLHQKAEDVIVFDEELHTFVNNMFETMYAANGIGLAATQVNVHKRVIVMDLGEGQGRQVFVNPTWSPVGTELSGLREGCLSVPGYYDSVPRYERVHVFALDEHGAQFDYEAAGLLALCIQHECDHLNGLVFVDHLSSLRKQRALTTMTKLKRSARKNK